MTGSSAADRAPGGALKVLDIINLSTSADTLLRGRVLAMRASGLDNRIVCIDGPRVESLRSSGIPVHTAHIPRSLDPFRLVRALLEIHAYLRRERVDVVHTHCSIPGFVGRLAARLAGVPVVIHTVHGFHFHERTPRLRRLPYLVAERFCGLFTDTLLTQNSGDLEQAERLGIGPQGRRLHIGNGVDLARFLPGSPARTNGSAVVTCVARLEPVKNHPMLLSAAAILKGRGVPFRLRLVGEGKMRRAYGELCRDLGIEDRVEFLGYRNDIPELLADTDVAVLVSEKEGLPRAVLEAMAAGIAVVGTRVPGTREAVRDGETGFLVELGDAPALADALERLLRDPELRARMGRRGHEIAAGSYDEQSIIERLRDLYRCRVRARRPAPDTAASR